MHHQSTIIAMSVIATSIGFAFGACAPPKPATDTDKLAAIAAACVVRVRAECKSDTIDTCPAYVECKAQIENWRTGGK